MTIRKTTAMIAAITMLAVGAFNVRYQLDYRNYKQATTAGRIIRIGGGR